jgi:hypothetical protein
MKNFILISSLTLYSISVFGQEIFSKDGVAIRGYDAVAYFTESKAVKGDDKFTFTWKNATWKFATENAREQFIADPEKFAPQFGGYCAYGMGDESGHKAPTAPDAWTIVDGKLYLNYDKDVRTLWKEKQDEFIDTANKNWPRVKLEKK